MDSDKLRSVARAIVSKQKGVLGGGRKQSHDQKAL